MSVDVSIYVESLVCVCADPLTYCGGEGIEMEGCDDDPDADEGVLGKTALGGSAKKSEGVKASGLLWWGEDSPLWLERANDEFFFRTGRIHGSRVELAGSSGRDVSTGI